MTDRSSTGPSRGRGRRALAYLGTALLRDRSALKETAREMGARLLERDFARRFPVPPLDASVLEKIYSTAVVTPPPAHLRSGNQSLQGLVFIVSLARALEAKTVFEIGTYNGLTAWTLARNLPTATVHTLDLPPDAAPRFRLAQDDALNRLEDEGRLYDLLPHEGVIVQHLGDSATFDFSPWYGATDVVYVDGAHSEEYVSSDTAQALQMAGDIGAIVWDDHWRQVPEVAIALSRQSGLRLRRVPDTRLVVHLAPEAATKLR